MRAWGALAGPEGGGDGMTRQLCDGTNYLGADPPVLSAHVAVKRVAGLGHSAA